MMQGRNHEIDDTLARIRSGTVGVEIGVWKGDSSEKLLTKAQHLHLVDPWSVVPYSNGAEYTDYSAFLARYAEMVGSTDPQAFDAYYEKVYQSVVNRFRGRSVTIHRMQSAQFFESFKSQVDWVYVDGLHSYDGCLCDLRGARKILKPGGILFGDDYGQPKSHRLGPVSIAVDDFLAETGLTLTRFGQHQFEIRP